MKKLYFLILLFLAAFNTGQAQTNVYHTFPDSNAYWCEDYTWGMCPATNGYTLFMSGDTTIGSNQYHKLYATGSISCPGYPPTNYSNRYRGAIRHDVLQKKFLFTANILNRMKSYTILI